MNTRSKKVVTKDVVDATELTQEAAETSVDESLQEEAKAVNESKPEATSAQFDLTLYSSTVCSPCKTIKPVLEQHMRGVGKVNYTVLTIDPNNLDEEVKKQFEDAGVTQVPTLICKEGDKEVGKLTGYSGTKQLLDALKNWGVF
ncbi:thioredoxin family protein [Acinetobacter nosocomialis]|uniref:thioredoxin family protein n=1 Tax=Acinetobacter nosocomialis TaxID=106654 RepID=UPI0033A03DA2